MSNEEVARHGSHAALTQGEEGSPAGTSRVYNDNGGYTKVTFGNDTPGQAEGPGVEGGRGVIDGSALRTHADGSVERVGGVVRVQTSNLASNLAASGGILNTAMSAMGNPTGDFTRKGLTVEIEPGNPASRTSIEAALTGGFLIRAADGSLSEPSISPQQMEGHNRKMEAQAHDGVELFPHAVEQTVADAIADLDQSVYEGAMARAAVTGDLSSLDFNSLAAETGKTPDQLRAAAELIQSAYHGQAVSAARSMGVADSDFDDFRSWAYATHPERAQEARLQHVHARNTSVLRELASEYLKAVPPSMETLAKAGYTVRHDRGTGRDLVTIDGKEMLVSTAARLGLL